MELINWIEPRSPGPCVCCCVCVCVWGVGIIKKDCEYCSSSGPRLPRLLTAAASGSVARNTGYIQNNKALHNRKISVCGLWVCWIGLVWFEIKKGFRWVFFSFKKTFLFDKVSFMFMYYWYVFCFLFFLLFAFCFSLIYRNYNNNHNNNNKKIDHNYYSTKKKISCFNNKIITKCCLHFVTCFCSSPPLLFSVASTLNISLVISYFWYIHTQIYRCVYACVCQCVCV